MGSEISIKTVPIRPDNYSYLLTWGHFVTVIDASEADPILQLVRSRNLQLLAVLSTHHHSDHTLGNMELKEKTGCSVISTDRRVKGVDRVVGDGEIISLEGVEIRAVLVPGHTKHQAAFYLESQKSLFTGDTLFGAGCGRVFEGSADQMYRSLEKLGSYPDETSVYFGHEYTAENLEFALSVEPGNRDVVGRLERVKETLSGGGYSTPSTVREEKRTNPFLRCRELSIRKALDMVDRSPIAVFAELRRRKDLF